MKLWAKKIACAFLIEDKGGGKEDREIEKDLFADYDEVKFPEASVWYSVLFSTRSRFLVILQSHWFLVCSYFVASVGLSCLYSLIFFFKYKVHGNSVDQVRNVE